MAGERSSTTRSRSSLARRTRSARARRLRWTRRATITAAWIATTVRRAPTASVMLNLPLLRGVRPAPPGNARWILPSPAPVRVVPSWVESLARHRVSMAPRRQDAATRSTARPALGDRLSAAREAGFVGRQGELELFRTALAVRSAPFAVLHLHGPGGRREDDPAAGVRPHRPRAGRPVIELDGRDVPPSRQAFVRSLAARRGPRDSRPGGADAASRLRRPDRHLRGPDRPGPLAARHAAADLAGRGRCRAGGARGAGAGVDHGRRLVEADARRAPGQLRSSRGPLLPRVPGGRHAGPCPRARVHPRASARPGPGGPSAGRAGGRASFDPVEVPDVVRSPLRACSWSTVPHGPAPRRPRRVRRWRGSPTSRSSSSCSARRKAGPLSNGCGRSPSCRAARAASFPHDLVRELRAGRRALARCRRAL